MKKPATLTLRDNKNALARRTERANALLAEALDCMLAGQPPVYGRTWTTCLKIKRFLKNGSIGTQGNP